MANQIYRPPAYSHNNWRKEQIFRSMETAHGIESGGVVPNVNDIVISWSGNIKIEERVVRVDPKTNISELEPVELPNTGNQSMVGVPVGVGNLSNVAQLIMNPIDPKLSATINNLLPIVGIDLSYVRVFLGTNISEDGQVISVRYDSNGNILDDKSPLVKAMVEQGDVLRYVSRPFNLTKLLPVDTLVTAVFYSDNNQEIMWQELVVKHNHIVANVQSEALFINDVYLESAYQNPLNASEVLIPKNLLNTSFAPRIFKEYQNGNREEMFIGTSNVSLAGWGDFVTGEVGERFPLVLTYILGFGEMSQKVDPHTGLHITSHYQAVVIDSDIETEVKLFVTPTYVNTGLGYRLKFWLYSGLRNKLIDVTDSVSYDGWSPTMYGAKQQVNFSIDLKPFADLPDQTFSDSVEIQLIGEPLANATMYRLWYWRDVTRWYGENLRAKISTNYGTRTLSLTNYIGSFSEWLDVMYYRLAPLYDATTSNEAPIPTHVDIEIGNVTMTMEIATYWNGELTWLEDTPAQGSNVMLKWYRYSEGGDRLDLAISNMPLEVI